jgi:phage shock protein B
LLQDHQSWKAGVIMQTLFILSIIFGFVILGLVIVGGIIIFSIKIIKGGFSHRDYQNQSHEARLMQNIYQGLSRLESRIETLEDLLLNPDGRGKSNGTV